MILTNRLSINHMRVFYRYSGPDDGRPIIFLHGFPLHSGSWIPQLNALPDGWLGIAPDIRGHGKSAIGDGIYSIDLFADDLLCFMDELKIDTATICGLSMGGYIALRALQKAPDRLSALILCDTRSAPDTDAGRLGRAATIKTVRKSGVEAFVTASLPNLLAPTTLRNNATVTTQVRQMIVSTAAKSICGTLMALAARTDTTESLLTSGKPVLFIAGHEDQLTPASEMELLAKQMPNSQFCSIENAGHLSNLENPEQFNSVLTHWLAEQ